MSLVLLARSQVWKLKKHFRDDSRDFRTVEARHTNGENKVILNRLRGPG